MSRENAARSVLRRVCGGRTLVVSGEGGKGGERGERVGGCDAEGDGGGKR